MSRICLCSQNEKVYQMKYFISQQSWYLHLHNIWMLWPKFYFWKGNILKFRVLSRLEIREVTRMQNFWHYLSSTLYFGWIKPVLKRCIVSKYYFRDCTSDTASNLPNRLLNKLKKYQPLEIGDWGSSLFHHHPIQWFHIFSFTLPSTRELYSE